MGSLPLVVSSSLGLALRYYQTDAIRTVGEFWAEEPDHHPLIALATGTGKTLTALTIVADEAEQGRRVLWLAHREELLVQPLEALARSFPSLAREAGIVQAGRNNVTARIVFGSFDTLRSAKRREALLAHGAFDLIVVDEAHHSPAKTYKKTLDALSGPGTRRVGLSATPDRDGMDGLGWVIAYSYGILDGIRDGYLVPPYATVARLENLDLSACLSDFGGDYDPDKLGRELLLKGIVEHTVNAMAGLHLACELPDRQKSRFLSCRGRPTLVFAASVEQARRTSDALQAAGWEARWISGETPPEDRAALLAGFKRGRIEVLVNVGVLTEGTDLPLCSATVMARPTRSFGMFSQILGRGLRPHGDKTESFVLDLVGATEDHSIVAAPVLVGGTKCSASPNGVHDFQPMANDPGGVCRFCEKTVACFGSLEGMEEFGSGAHRWFDRPDGHRSCSVCDSPQCKPSPTGAHLWLWESVKRLCAHCGVEIRDPHASMAEKRAKEITAEADWIRVLGVAPETWTVDCGDLGHLYIVGDRTAGQFTPWLVRHGGRKARALTPGGRPISKELVRTYTDDIVTRVKRIGGYDRPISRAQRDFATTIGLDLQGLRTMADVSWEITRTLAKARVVELGLAKESA